MLPLIYKENIMVDKDLIIYIRKTYNLTNIVSKHLLNDVLTKIKIAVKNGENVKLRNFGVFKSKILKSRICRDPRNGERIDSPSKKKIIFKVSKEFKSFLNS